MASSSKSARSSEATRQLALERAKVENLGGVIAGNSAPADAAAGGIVASGTGRMTINGGAAAAPTSSYEMARTTPLLGTAAEHRRRVADLIGL